MRRLVRRLRVGTLVRAAAGAAALLLVAGASGGSAQPLQSAGLTVHLSPGWNNVPYYGPAVDPRLGLASIAGHYSLVYQWDSVQQRYLTFDPGNPTAGDLRQLAPGHAYWIVATAYTDLSFGPPQAGSVPALTHGWNNFVYTGPALPVDQALASLSGHYGAVYAWDPVLQRFRTFAPGATGDNAMLAPFACYWINFS